MSVSSCRITTLFALSVIALSSAAAQSNSPAPLRYPVTKTVPHVDDYHGSKMADPFRWLEDDTASAVKSWVTEQNALTFDVLGRIPFRGALLDRLKQLNNYEKISAPSRSHGWVVYAKNSGLQNQSVFYIQRGLAGKPRVLLDPNTLSKDGTTRVGSISIDQRGQQLAYTTSQAGSDWQEIHVMDPVTLAPKTDRIRWVKFSGVAWRGAGFYYSRYPAPADTTRALSETNGNQQVYYHALGTPQSRDQLVFGDPAHPQRFHFASTTSDERFLILDLQDRGAGKDGNALWVRDLTSRDSAWMKVVTSFDDRFVVLDNDGASLIVQTNHGAKNGRIVRIDPARPAEANWVTLVPERAEPLEGASTAGRHIFASYLKDVAGMVVQYRYDGTREREVELPGLGSVNGFTGEQSDTDAFYTFVSFTAPPTTYRYDLASGRSTKYLEPKLPFDPTKFETKQLFFTSKDGTKVPMFVIAKKGLVLDGRNPTMVYGYGGFNAAETPSFSASRIAWLEQGGVWVTVSLRGGSEYGDAWHEAGMKEKKQNVFDDFTAAAEYLIKNKYTSSDRLAMKGASNGGLAIGAVMTQRPELFAVALPAVGVMDMLRFQKFTIGWNWVADYGSSDTPDGFRYLSAYSPLHNLKDGTAYPATLITTADHDDRVVPAHSFKFAARLQQAHKGANPVLIRIETASGHGSSSLTKALAIAADEYAFTMSYLKMTPIFPSAIVP